VDYNFNRCSDNINWIGLYSDSQKEKIGYKRLDPIKNVADSFRNRGTYMLFVNRTTLTILTNSITSVLYRTTKSIHYNKSVNDVIIPRNCAIVIGTMAFIFAV
jgi:hypothetical protein